MSSNCRSGFFSCVGVQLVFYTCLIYGILHGTCYNIFLCNLSFICF